MLRSNHKNDLTVRRFSFFSLNGYLFSEAVVTNE